MIDVIWVVVGLFVFIAGCASVKLRSWAGVVGVLIVAALWPVYAALAVFLFVLGFIRGAVSEVRVQIRAWRTMRKIIRDVEDRP